jgi:hypothetical protein
MGFKYSISAFQYPYKGYAEYSYGTKNFFKFLFVLIKCKLIYHGVTAEIRK